MEGSVSHGLAADPSRYARLGFDGVGADRRHRSRAAAEVRGRPWSSRSGRRPVPFDEMISPCWRAGIRGLPDGLLRDRSGLVGTAEYRS